MEQVFLSLLFFEKQLGLILALREWCKSFLLLDILLDIGVLHTFDGAIGGSLDSHKFIYYLESPLYHIEIIHNLEKNMPLHRQSAEWRRSYSKFYISDHFYYFFIPLLDCSDKYTQNMWIFLQSFSQNFSCSFHRAFFQNIRDTLRLKFVTYTINNISLPKC